MKEKIYLIKKKSFEIVSGLQKNQKISLAIGVLFVAGSIGVLVYADAGHDAPEPVVIQQSEQVIVRKVGDVDADAISQEGLSSFFGEVISKDIASVHSSREGVITSWNVSVGDRVSAGTVLGYVTVTGVSPEQQMQLAEQQANALKAKLDLDTVNIIATQTETVFGKIDYNEDLMESTYGIAKKTNLVTEGTLSTGLGSVRFDTLSKGKLDSAISGKANVTTATKYEVEKNGYALKVSCRPKR